MDESPPNFVQSTNLTANANSKINETLIGNSNDQSINKTTNVNDLNAQ